MSSDSGSNSRPVTDATANTGTLSFRDIFSLGRELAPRQTTFVVVGLVLLTGAAITATWGGLPMLIATALALLVGALLVNLLVKALRGKRLDRLGEFVAWVSVVLTFLLLALLLAAAFLPWPGPVGNLLTNSFGESSPPEHRDLGGGTDVKGPPVVLNFDAALSGLPSEMQLPPEPASGYRQTNVAGGAGG